MSELERCPMCRSADLIVFSSTWPAWYTPPPATVAVRVCTGCDLVLGSVELTEWSAARDRSRPRCGPAA